MNKTGYIVTAVDDIELIAAFKEIKSGKWKKASEVSFKKKNALALKTYYWLYYTKNAGPIDFKRISAFIERNPDWPKQKLLEKRAERNMSSGLSNADIVSWFRIHSPQTSDGMEQYMQAMKKIGAKNHMKKVINAWWRKTLLSSGKQKHFLKVYGHLLSHESHKVRFDHLLFNRHYTNARALSGLLGKGYRQLADARIALAENRGGVDRKIALVPSILRENPGLLYERLRWRRRHDMDFSAMEILHNAPPVETISNLSDWWVERHIIARRLMKNEQYASAYLLVDGHMQQKGLGFVQAEFLTGWLALTHMNKPWQAFERFESLYNKTSTPISRARGSYWAGRSSEALGYPDVARKWYKIAARHQTVFYGQMAVEVLEAEHKPPQQMPPKITVEGYQNFYNREIVQAAILLDRAGLSKAAEDFLDELSWNVNTPENFRLAAEFAQDMGYQHNALRTAKRAWKKNIFLVDQSYPTILAMLGEVEIEWALVHAVIRQESAFDYKIKSPAGAIGLMQLMPSTAREVAKKSRIPHRKSWLSSRPEHNIELGTRYLAQMLDRFDGSYPLAVAAYNAGPTRVDRWLKQSGDPRTDAIEMIDWIETFPIYETRNYVQRVMEGVYVYRLLLKDVQKNVASSIHVAMSN